MAGDVWSSRIEAASTVGRSRRVLKCPAMKTTSPVRETAPPRRVSLVLHPRRDVPSPSTSSPHGPGGPAPSSPPSRTAGCPRTSAAAASTSSPTGATSCSPSAATGRCSAACAWPRRAACPSWARTSAAWATSPRSTASTWPDGLEALGAGAYARRGALHAARRLGRAATARARRLQRRRPQPRPGPRPGPAGAARRRPAPVRYASDGVIAATPAGSTAYSYAAGGPIVSPQTRAMIVTPDAPHGLFDRGVVLGAEERLGVEVLPEQRPGRGRGRRPAARGGRPGLDPRDHPEPVAGARRAARLGRLRRARAAQARDHRSRRAGQLRLRGPRALSRPAVVGGGRLGTIGQRGGERLARPGIMPGAVMEEQHRRRHADVRLRQSCRMTIEIASPSSPGQAPGWGARLPRRCWPRLPSGAGRPAGGGAARDARRAPGSSPTARSSCRRTSPSATPSPRSSRACAASSAASTSSSTTPGRFGRPAPIEGVALRTGRRSSRPTSRGPSPAPRRPIGR